MNRRSRKRSNWVILISGGVLSVWLLQHIRSQKGVFPHINSVQKGLSEKYGDVESAFLAGKLQQRFEVLYIERPRFGDRKLQTHVDELIIPVLALYKVLLEKTGDIEQALTEVHGLMKSIVIIKSKTMVSALGKFPDPFSVLKRAVRFVNRMVFSAPGWKIEYIQDDQEVIAFNIHHCLFLNILTAYGVPELTKVFCQFDDDIAAFFPPQILWERENTMASGADLCDFCYRRSQVEIKEQV